MKKYNYEYRQDLTMFEIRQSTHIVCYTKTKGRAKEIIRMYREKARKEEWYPFGE